MNYLVVAVWNETWGWTAKYADEWQPVIIRKGFDLPNLGREASSYFFAMHKLYDRLEPEDFVACVQGNPFDHAPDLAASLRQRPSRFAWIGDGRNEYSCDGSGAPHAAGMDIDIGMKKWCGKGPRQTYWFVPGGQFIVSGSAILRRPKDWYEEMWRDICAYDNTLMSAYVMERLWKYLWT